MHANSFRPDDLNDLERRVASWRPDDTGLNPDAMLFAAGRASVSPPNRLLWPALTTALALAVAGLSIWLGFERSERRVLAERLRHPVAPTSPTPLETPGFPPESAPPSTGETPDAYLTLRTRVLTGGGDAWLNATPGPEGPPEPAANETATTHVWWRAHVLDP